MRRTRSLVGVLLFVVFSVALARVASATPTPAATIGGIRIWKERMPATTDGTHHARARTSPVGVAGAAADLTATGGRADEAIDGREDTAVELPSNGAAAVEIL